MNDALLCLNSEWQGSESPELEAGSRYLAASLFGDRSYVDFGPPCSGRVERRDDVFALDFIAARLAAVLETLRRADPERVFTVAGTCGAEAGPVGYLRSRYGEELGVVWFDAHGDLNTPASSPSGHFHGMVLRTLLGEGPPSLLEQLGARLDPRSVLLAGVRDLDEAESAYIERTGMPVMRDRCEEPIADAVESLLARGVRTLYVHVDADAFDPRDFGHALLPVPGGPSLERVARLTTALRERFEIVGVGVTEYHLPDRDSADAMARFLRDAGLWLPKA